MKIKKIINSVIYIYANILFLISCGNRAAENSSLREVFQQHKSEEKILLENGWLQHEFVADGKRISFILPEYYVHTDTCDWCVSAKYSGCDIDTLQAFCIVNNNYKYYNNYNNYNYYNYFEVTIQPSDDNDSMIDSYFKKHFYFYTAQEMVPFFERKQDENNHIYYLIMTSKLEKNDRGNYIYSRFYYVTIFGEQFYACGVVAYEPVSNSFSYEEKRKIIESVRIEDIK